MKLAPRLGAATLVLVTAFSGAAVVAPSAAGATAGTTVAPTAVATSAAARTTTPQADRRRTDRFKIATFNVLGASHTGRRSGLRRTKGLVHMLGSRGVAIAGLQEFERTQYLRFRRLTHGRWGVVSVPRGKGIDTRNAIVFNKKRFRLLWKSSLSIPYYGPEVRVPIARLKSRATGKVFYVMNTHNAAGKSRSIKRKRQVAVRRQVRQLAHLRRRGATTFFVGDMNDRTRVHCAITRKRTFKSASGGSIGRRCSPPRRNSIDWIFGTRDVTFARWRSDKAPLKRRISDHRLVVVRVRIQR